MAHSGFDATLTINGQAIDDITMIKAPSNAVADADITTLTSGGTPPRQLFMPIKVDPGEGEFECLYAASTYTQLEGLVGIVHPFIIVFSDGGALHFSAFINKGPESENNQTDAVRIKCSFKMSGEASALPS